MFADDAAPAQSIEDCRAQLLRYAQDLVDLLDQHGKLQQRYQALLQEQGRGPHANDQLLDLVCHARQALVITDAQGNITRANRAAREVLQGTGPDAVPVGNLCERFAPGPRATLERMLARFSTRVSSEAVVMGRFELIDPARADQCLPFALMAVPERGPGQTLVYWVMHALTGEPSATLTPQLLLPQTDPRYGVMVTDPGERITAVNAGLCHMCEYSAEELLGQRAGLLASGRHDNEFYRSLWTRLQALGSWTGELLNRRKSGHIYPQWSTMKTVYDVRGRQLGYVAVVRDTSTQDHSIEQLSKLAFYDALTGLPNRRLLEDRLCLATKTARRKGSGLSVLFMDLDRFKPINDRFGHDTGDAVLQQVGARLQAAVRATDTVARVGGDEFVLLLPDTGTPDELAGVVDKLLQALAAPIVVGPHAHSVGASIGSARFPADGEDAAALIRHADAAMYRNKQRRNPAPQAAARDHESPVLATP